MNELAVLRIYSFKATLVVVFVFFLKHGIPHHASNDVGLSKVIYELSENKRGCVFGNAHQVISISHAGGRSRLHLWNESRPCLPMASHCHGPLSTCRWHPKRYRSWASEVGGR